MDSTADYFFLPLQELHRHPRNGFWRNFWQDNCFELKSPQHSVPVKHLTELRIFRAPWLTQLNDYGFALLKVQRAATCSQPSHCPPFRPFCMSTPNKHTILKRVRGISKWCRFIQGWKIYALGVENLKWQEEKLSSSLGMGSSKMHYSW